VPAKTRLAQLVSREEGFGIPGSIPTRRNNPGDLRHAPHTSHEGIGPNDIGEEPTVDDGWDDLERQLRLYAERGMTIRAMVEAYAPSNENNTEQYLEFLCDALAVTPETPVSVALEIPAGV